MAVEIRETTVTPGAKSDVVQLHISDAPPGDESATFVLTISSEVGAFEMPVLAQLQREAMKKAGDVLHRLLQQAAVDIRASDYELDPKPRKPKAPRVWTDR